MTEHPEPDEIILGPGPRPRHRSYRRTGVIGLVAVGGLAAGGAALYVANSAGAAPSTPSAPGSSASSTTAPSSSATACPAPPKPGAGRRPVGGPRPGGPARGPGAGNGADGRITAVSSTSLTVRDLFAKSHTYKITSATVIHSGPARSTKASRLAVGEHVVVRTAGSTTTAADIDLRLARIDGAVTSVASAAITVTDRDGFTRTIDTTGQTKYTLDAASSRAKVTTGSVVHAEGQVDADGTALDATTVDVVTAPTKAPTAGPRPCALAGGHGPAGPGHVGPGKRAGRPGAPTPSSTSTSAPTASPTPSATTSR